jgi:L-threonylcarbamoyladenylate synthase
MTKVIKVDPLTPCPSVMSEAGLLINRGGTVAFPTETLYGLGVCALKEESILKVFQIKDRDYGNPIPILIDKKEALSGLVGKVPEKAQRLMEEFWPGALTIVFEASPTVSPLLTGNTGKIGIRISSNAIAHLLVTETGAPITASSANISGQKGCTTAFEVYENLGNRVDLIIDGGETRGHLGSTVIDVTSSPIKVIREGVISLRDLRKYL